MYEIILFPYFLLDRLITSMSSDTFSLKWDKFGNNSSFQALHKDTDLRDVTLASSDGQTVGAHKVVLSSCSPVFRSMLVKNSHPSPLLYLRGVKLSQLQKILAFCYLGQAEVLQEELEEFLEVARDMGIKGLSQEDTQEQKQEHVQKNRRQKKNKRSFEITTQNSTDIGSEIIISTIKTDSLKIRADENIIDYSTAFSLDPSESSENQTKTKDNMIAHDCSSCGKSYSIKYALNKHVKEKHTNDYSLSCSKCDWTGVRKYLLLKQMKNAHDIDE